MNKFTFAFEYFNFSFFYFTGNKAICISQNAVND